MSTELERLIVRFSGDTRDLLNAFKESNQGSATFSKTIEKNNSIAEKSLKSLRVIGASAYLELANKALQAARASYDFVKGAIEAADAVGDNAAAVGLGTEAYQRYAQAVSFSDVSNEQFDSGMRKLTDNVGEALAGVKTATDKFRALGVELRDTNGHVKTQDQLLGEVLTNLGQYGSEAERAAIATDLFGKGVGPKLAVFAAQGGDAIDDLKAKAVVFSKEQIKLAERINDQWDRMVANGYTKLKGAILDLIQLSAQEFTTIESLRGEYARLNKEIAEYGRIRSVFSDAGPAGQDFAQNIKKREEIRAKLEAAERGERAAAETRDRAALNSQLGRLNREAAEENEKLNEKAAAKAKQLAERSAEERKAADKKAQAEVIQALEENVRRREDIEEALALNQRERLEALAAETDYNRARQAEDQAAADAVSKERLDRMIDAGRDLGTELTRAFTDAATEGENAFARMEKALLKFVQQMIVQEAVARPLQGFLGGLFGGAGSAGVTGSGAGAAARSAIGGAFGSLFGGGRAAGGPVSAGTLYEVNENRREFFKPSVPGRVVPLAEANAAGGAGGAAINVVVNNSSSGARASAQPDGSGGLRILVEDIVADSARRNGSAARALRSASGGTRPPLSGKE